MGVDYLPVSRYLSSMLETPDYPSLSRVMRIQPQPDEKPASGFSWGDYEDVDATKKATEGTDGEDDGWGVVKSKSRASKQLIYLPNAYLTSR